MTLSTHVYVLDEIDPRRVFVRCQQLLQKYDDGQHRPPEAQKSSERAGWSGDYRLFANSMDQGLPALLDVSYRPGAALTPEDPGCDEDCDEDCSRTYHARVCWLYIDFDTTYSYRDERGWGCGDLHAAMLGELGQWLDAQGVKWEWRNEFSGDVWGGDDRYVRLVDLGKGGAEAGAWFRNVALPAIAVSTLDGGL